MHGTIFFELKKYVETKLGEEAWKTLLKEAGLGEKNYEVMAEYPDSEAVALVSTASKITGQPATAILEDFGEFIAPDLIQMYWAVIQPGWKTLDVIEHTEEEIHKVVRLNNPGAHPPELKCIRKSPDEVVIHYNSPRKMCSVAKGIVRGLAKYYGEDILLSESSCMLKGDSLCILSARQGYKG